MPTKTPKPRVRRVTRVVRAIDAWSVFKVMIIFHFALYISVLISSILLWNVAHATGTVDNVERFMESFGWETFSFNGEEMFRNLWVIGLLLVFLLTGLAVLASAVFNLLADLVGGIRVTVLEEEVVLKVVEPAPAPEAPKPVTNPEATAPSETPDPVEAAENDR